MNFNFEWKLETLSFSSVLQIKRFCCLKERMSWNTKWPFQNEIHLKIKFLSFLHSTKIYLAIFYFWHFFFLFTKFYTFLTQLLLDDFKLKTLENFLLFCYSNRISFYSSFIICPLELLRTLGPLFFVSIHVSIWL